MEPTTRRPFLNLLLGTSLGGLAASVFYPVLRFLSPPDVPEATTNEVDAGSAEDPAFAEKGYKIVRFGGEPVIVVRLASGDFRAFTATCTHLDCIVQYRKDRDLIWCYCHNGAYDLNGRNVSGPPPKPLTPFVVHLVDKNDGSGRKLVVART
jgi:Rieske Fe-S protein